MCNCDIPVFKILLYSLDNQFDIYNAVRISTACYPVCRGDFNTTKHTAMDQLSDKILLKSRMIFFRSRLANSPVIISPAFSWSRVQNKKFYTDCAVPIS